MNQKPVPDFAVFQNSRTMTSAIWTKDRGEWIHCEKHEYPAILILVTLLRESPNPAATMEEIAKMMRSGSGFGSE
jgi:hypothetical protein